MAGHYPICNTWRSQSSLTNRGDMAKHQAPRAPSLQRAFWLSLWAFTRTLWSPEKDAQNKMRFRTSLQTLSCFEKNEQKVSNKKLVGQWKVGFSFTSALGPRTCGGFHLSSCATLLMTNQCWVVHWHQIPRLRGSAGTSAQRTSNRAINLKPPGLPPSSSARKKKSIEFGRHLWMKVSHHSPLQKKKFDLELPKQRCPISRQPASDTSGPQFHPNGNGTSSRGPTQPTVPQAAMESPQPRWRSMDRMTSFTLSKLSRIKAWTNTKTCWGNSLQFTPVFPNKTGGTTVSTIYTTQTIIF